MQATTKMQFAFNVYCLRHIIFKALSFLATLQINAYTYGVGILIISTFQFRVSVIRYPFTRLKHTLFSNLIYFVLGYMKNIPPKIAIPLLVFLVQGQRG